MATVTITVPDNKIAALRTACAAETGGSANDAAIQQVAIKLLADVLTQNLKNAAVNGVATETLS
jgi:hypothetical protein